MERSAACAAYSACLAIAEDRARCAGSGDYAEGYRTAARDVIAAIRERHYCEVPPAFARDLRDAEAEARMLARVVGAAADVVRDVGEETDEADAVREVLAPFLEAADLPPSLRARTSYESSTQLTTRRGGAA